jgi:hypothetical protein
MKVLSSAGVENNTVTHSGKMWKNSTIFYVAYLKNIY